ncbi:CRP-like cAMP-binding protein [Micromonospora sp. Llam0]|uniref:Crp/Fnr family transcriptional regulator n=1 Tax=Micromonospora sp. Llam0 TaxID=2485143 RepID=UPI000F498EE0|nr:Crp/Fnr family transcriptional regulator [Micromonospora sp. Llam0]ROO52032.1 CRP-like cAMP-binding protein [Micromonospora sp. Llam0]
MAVHPGAAAAWLAAPGPRRPAAAALHPGTPAQTGTSTDVASYCLVDGLDALYQPAWGTAPPPWAPGRREEAAHVERIAAGFDRTYCLSEVDIFTDLSATELDAIAAMTPMKTYAVGELLYSPHNPVETLFILKQGRVRIFRVAADGRALTTALITPGTIFGEMVLLGQHMYDNYAEALDEAVVCVLDRSCVQQHLLSDSCIATRITEILGQRLIEMERRLSDTVFKSVPQRVAGTLATLAGQQRRLGVGPRTAQVALTHEQLAALVGTSRETATKTLGELADRGLIRLGRGKITILDPVGVAAEAGD